MRKIIESTLVSLDGVFGDPHIWATEYFEPEAERYALELLSMADAMLMGRRTYEFFAAAFPIKQASTALGSTSIHKYVFSNTLKKAGWSNSSIIKGDVVAEVAKHKQQDGNDLVIYGQGLIGQTLLEGHLLDQLKLWIHPTLVGRGQLVLSGRRKNKTEARRD